MQELLRAAIYARVSSEQPTDGGGGGIASQIAALEARVATDGLVLPATQRFVDDGYTARRRAGAACAAFSAASSAASASALSRPSLSSAFSTVRTAICPRCSAMTP